MLLSILVRLQGNIAHLRTVLSNLVLTKFRTYNNSGFPSSSSMRELRTPGVSSARTGAIVLKGVWFRKKIVQSSGCLSAPSGSIRCASSLRKDVRRPNDRFLYHDEPFICAEWLRELIRELGAAVDVEVSQKNEGAVFGVAAHRAGHGNERQARTSPATSDVRSGRFVGVQRDIRCEIC